MFLHLLRDVLRRRTVGLVRNSVHFDKRVIEGLAGVIAVSRAHDKKVTNEILCCKCKKGLGLTMLFTKEAAGHRTFIRNVFPPWAVKLVSSGHDLFEQFHIVFVIEGRVSTEPDLMINTGNSNGSTIQWLTHKMYVITPMDHKSTAFP